jgi:hypothetical protein
MPFGFIDPTDDLKFTAGVGIFLLGSATVRTAHSPSAKAESDPREPGACAVIGL